MKCPFGVKTAEVRNCKFQANTCDLQVPKGYQGKEEMDLFFLLRLVSGGLVLGGLVLGCGCFADDCNERLVTRFLNPQKMALKDVQEFQAFDAKKIMQWKSCHLAHRDKVFKQPPPHLLKNWRCFLSWQNRFSRSGFCSSQARLVAFSSPRLPGIQFLQDL